MAHRAIRGGQQGERCGLEQHAPDDERLASGAVGPVSGPDLSDAPDSGVEPSDEPYVARGCAVCDKEERHDAPGESVVEVVDQSRLRARSQRWVAKARLREGSSDRRLRRATAV